MRLPFNRPMCKAELSVRKAMEKHNQGIKLMNEVNYFATMKFHKPYRPEEDGGYLKIRYDWITSEGYRAVIVNNSGAFYCGYVEVPEDHPFYKFDTSDKYKDTYYFCIDENVEVHNGATYGETLTHLRPDLDGWYLGFDCAHAEDGFLPGFEPKSDIEKEVAEDPERVTKPYGYVVEQCLLMSRELAAVANGRKIVVND